MRRRLAPLAAIVLAAALTQAGCGATQPASRAPSPAQTRAALAGSPPALARLHARAGELLSGGRPAMEAQLAALRGHPVVVNKWASWCAPCRQEFPLFQRAAVTFGRQVAFLGLDAGDRRPDAARFLARFPVSYPSFEDPSESISRAIGAPGGYPITVFFDARGRSAYIHQGAYTTQALLVRDIRRYALGT